jgi:hypothetical protein
MRRAATATLFLVTAGSAFLAGCAAKGPGPLYLWESFPKQQYAVLLKSGADPTQQIQTLTAQAEKARLTNAALPPGFRAHLGMMELSVGNTVRARELWEAEKAAFPESTPYMDQLLKRLESPTKPEKNGDPA